MSHVLPEALISTEWLADHLSAPDVRVVDATWFPPTAGRNPRDDYDAAHIPGAVFFDIDEISDTNVSLPHMLPEAAKFASKVRRLGLGNGHKVVIYDRNNFMASARVWWMFRHFGHRDVVVLDGGFAKWQAEGRATEDLPPMRRDRHFLPHVNTALVRSFDQVKAALDNDKIQIVDARSAERFSGKGDEPWPVKHKGHMPGALNVPFGELITAQGTMKSPADLKARFEAAGLDFSKQVITSCGSGVTACVLALGLYLTGKEDVSVYDGSWSEWGNHDEAVAVQD